MDVRGVDCGVVTLEVAEAGAGGRPLVLVHGFTGAKEDLSHLLDPLAERGWHAVAPDLRGHGGSDHPEGEGSYSLAIYAADVMALAGTLGWGRFAALGYSMGGMIVQRLALDHPGRLRALVLLDTSHGRPDGLEPELVALGASIVRREGMEELMVAQDRLAERLAESEPRVAPRAGRERPEWREYGRHKLLRSSPDMWVAMSAEMVSEADRLEELRSLQLPVLVICGDRDAAFLGPSERMAQAIPGARLVMIPGAGHAPQFERPQACWDALRAFLDELAM